MTDATTIPAATDPAADPSTNPAASTPEGGTDPAEGQGQGNPAADPATADPAAPTGAPDTYEFTLPEGLALEGERMDATVALFKKMDLPQDKAQELVDFFVQMREGGEAAAADQLAARNEELLAQSKTEFGSNFEQIGKDARAGLTWAQQHRPGILDTFDANGFGNHPDALWAFAKLGELTRGSSMDGLGGETAGGDVPAQDMSRRWYPDLAPKQ